ncbi:MAG: hypothetical protein U0103_21425 [Candidatus Obscuribacterales bacterium]
MRTDACKRDWLLAASIALLSTINQNTSAQTVPPAPGVSASTHGSQLPPASGSGKANETTSTSGNGTLPADANAAPDFQLNVPATNRTEAMLKARIGAGRSDPFAQPIYAFKSLLSEPTVMKQPKALHKVHLPPPPTDSTLAPPPPPTETIMPGLASQSVGQAGQLAGGSDMPEPPEKPLISEKMKLVGVLADKAFFTFTDIGLRRANKFPSTVVLANGEQFESVHLVSVAPNSVVLEEDGERVTKELERIR